jgi:hypothetical protein
MTSSACDAGSGIGWNTCSTTPSAMTSVSRSYNVMSPAVKVGNPNAAASVRRGSGMSG